MIAPSLWNRWTLFKSFNIIFWGFTISFIYFIVIAANYTWGMILYMTITMIAVNIFIIFIYMIKFSGFDPKVGLYVAKYLDFSYLISFIIVVIFNYLFYSESNITLIMKAFALISLIASVFFSKKFENLQQKLLSY